MSELRECSLCRGKAQIERKGTARQSMVIVCEDCGLRCESGDVYGVTPVESYRWNTRPADAVRVKGEKFLRAVEAYHDAIKLRDDVENSHMWSRELRVMYDAMVGFHAALAQDGKEHP